MTFHNVGTFVFLHEIDNCEPLVGGLILESFFFTLFQNAFLQHEIGMV